MRKSIYFKIFIATALIVLISFSLLGGLSMAMNYRRISSESRSMMFSALRETTMYISERTYHGDAVIDDPDLNLNTWLAMTSGITGFDLLVTDIDGTVIASSDNTAYHNGKIVPQYLVEFADSRVYDTIWSKMGDLYISDRQVAAVPLANTSGSGNSRVFGYLFVTCDLEALTQQWIGYSGAFMAIAIGVMAPAFVVSFIAAKKQTEPINEMANTALRFARGEFKERVKDRGRTDEIGRLTHAFNAMAESLENSETHKRELITNLSHELKTPMTVITGFAEGLLDGTIPRKDEARYLGVISSETRRMTRIVRSMLEISTLESSKQSAVLKSSFDVAEVVRIALLSLGGKIEKKNLYVQADLPDNELMANGDKDAIAQVIYNLVDNAIKFSDNGSVLGLKAWKENGSVHVSVKNKGETIPKEDLPHIFNRFHKADKSRSSDRDGIGLGLYIVKQILDTHDADINVTRQDDVTNFTFSLNTS